VPIENNLASDLQLIVPNLHRRYSGVTATNRMVAPKLATMYRAAWLGPHAPDGIARMGFAVMLPASINGKPFACLLSFFALHLLIMAVTKVSSTVHFVSRGSAVSGRQRPLTRPTRRHRARSPGR